MKNSVHFLREWKRAGLIAGALAGLFLSVMAVRGVVLSAVNHTNSPATPKLLTAVMPGKTGVSFCACCADQGVWFQSSREISEFEREMLAELKLQTARLHLTAAEKDDWRGIAAAGDSLEEDFALTFTPASNQWTLIFKSKRGESGKLILTLPAKATELGVDTSKELPPRAPVTLYKELRLEGTMRGTGVFAQGNAPGTKYRLVLQGEGAMCFSASDYYRWNLRVSGPKASYTFYGLFAKPR